MLDMGLFKLHDSLTLSHVPPTAEGFSRSLQLPFFVPSLWCSTEKANGAQIFPKHFKSYGELALSMAWWYLRQWFSTYWLNSENTSYMRTGVTFSSFSECSFTKNLCRGGREQRKMESKEELSWQRFTELSSLDFIAHWLFPKLQMDKMRSSPPWIHNQSMYCGHKGDKWTSMMN